MRTKRKTCRVLTAALLLAASLSAAPLLAQNQPTSADAATEDSTIVVTGGAFPDPKRIRALSHAITPHGGYAEPLARFTDPVCFVAAGLPHDLLIKISNRLAIDAHTAGMPLGGANCRPNVAVLFVDDSASELKNVRAHYPNLFGNLEPADIREIVREPGPVHTWWVTQTASSDGDLPFASPSGGAAPMLTVRSSSFIVLPIRTDVRFAVLVIDRRALLGLSSDQIADYAALRTLSGARPPAIEDGNTILTLFQPGATPPAEMTSFDRSYLKALYSGRGNEPATRKVSQMARAVMRDAKERAAGGEQDNEAAQN